MTVTTLMPDAGAPLVLHIGANALLFAHIAGGSVAIAAGYVAVAVKKGQKLHRAWGNAFFLAMSVMTGVAAVTAPFLDEAWTNTTAAIFSMYLIATGWLAVKRPAGQVGRVERLIIAVPSGIIVVAMAQAVANAGTPRMAGFATIFAFAAVCAMAIACDLGVIRKGGLVGPPRVARHLWRTCAAFFVATGSFFFGQADTLPEAWRGSLPIVMLGVAPLFVLAFWMARVRLLPWLRPRRRRQATVA